MCSPSAQYQANLGTVTIATANSNLNGTGAMGTVITATATANGTVITSVTIKATGSTTQGMIRLFIDDTVNIRLYMEISVPGNTQSGTMPAFGITIPLNIFLAPGYRLKASTQNGQTFNVTGYAQDWINCACPTT